MGTEVETCTFRYEVKPDITSKLRKHLKQKELAYVVVHQETTLQEVACQIEQQLSTRLCLAPGYRLIVTCICDHPSPTSDNQLNHYFEMNACRHCKLKDFARSNRGTAYLDLLTCCAAR